MKSIKVQFEVGERVLILDLEKTPSRVTQVCVGANSTTYEVAWFHNGERKTAWLHAHEIKSCEPPPAPTRPPLKIITGGRKTDHARQEEGGA